MNYGKTATGIVTTFSASSYIKQITNITTDFCRQRSCKDLEPHWLAAILPVKVASPHAQRSPSTPTKISNPAHHKHLLRTPSAQKFSRLRSSFPCSKFPPPTKPHGRSRSCDRAQHIGRAGSPRTSVGADVQRRVGRDAEEDLVRKLRGLLSDDGGAQAGDAEAVLEGLCGAVGGEV
jgi:hypothetical protein